MNSGRAGHHVSRVFWKVARILALVYVGFGAYLYFNQRSVIYLSEFTDAESCARFESGGADRIDRDGTTFYYKKNGPAIVVFYHGNAGTVCDRKFLSDFFDEQGVSYLFVEYAGYVDGLTPSKPTFLGNVRDADGFLGTIRYDTLILMGESLGTGLATEHAKLRAPDALILVSPYTSIADLASAHYPWYPARFMVKDNFTVDFGEKTFHGRLLVIHGEADGVIPYGQGKTVFDSAPFSVKEFLSLEGADHNDSYHGDVVFRTISRFLLPSHPSDL